jgi:predicted dehydrogenase
MSDPFSRRQFIAAAIAAGTMIPVAQSVRPLRADEPARKRGPNDRLNIAVIGVEAQGAYNRDNVAGDMGENIYALCDIDSERLAKASAKYPKARTLADLRAVFDLKEIDAVVVATPDHTHAVPSALALRRGLPVYCEKPLTHTVHETRVLRTLAKEHNCVTQMGTQVHAGDNYRRVVELVQANVIGPVNRVHVWMNGMIPGLKRRTSTPPAHVDYDLWLGPVSDRPFNDQSFHFNWRYWFDFGGGQLGDFGCHFMDLPFWALGLTAPTTVACTAAEMAHGGDNDCPGKLQIDYQFPGRGNQPAVHLTWYHGGYMPPGAEMYRKSAAVLFEGPEGRILADYGSHKVMLQSGGEVEPLQPSIPDSVGHHKEWLDAIRNGGPTTCNFDYSGGLTEAVLLGNVAYKSESKLLTWDSDAFKVTNDTAANEFLHFEYRKGWTL